VVCIDEVHRVPPDGEGQYRTFIEAAKRLNPNVCLIGLTATPYRMTSGMICGKDQLFDRICFEIGVRELIVKGFLSPLKSKATTQRTDLSNVSIRGGEYAQGELQAAMTGDEGKVVMACSEIAGKTDERKSVLVFCTGIDHANMVARFLQDLAGEDQVRTVFGDTPDDLRAEAIASFKRGAVKFLVNVDVLTTGFDAPAVDAVAILRPTLSPGLFYQMVGRGFRLADGKKDCLVLDFGDNLFRHGPVDRMVITEDKKTGQVGNSGARFKECPKCSEVLPWSCEICLECGEKLPKAEAEVKHGDIAADRDALSGPEKVLTTVYQKHEKDKDGRKSVTLRVNYDCGLMWPVSEFLCFEHPPGFARNKALEWWRARSSEPVPSTIDQALETIRTKGIKEPSQLVLKSEGKYLRVEKYIDMTFKPDPNVWLGEKTQPVDDKAFTNIPF
jgi:DNA repair protein RadD